MLVKIKVFSLNDAKSEDFFSVSKYFIWRMSS